MRWMSRLNQTKDGGKVTALSVQQNFMHSNSLWRCWNPPLTNTPPAVLSCRSTSASLIQRPLTGLGVLSSVNVLSILEHSSSLNDLRVVGYWWSLVIYSVNAIMSHSSEICGLLWCHNDAIIRHVTGHTNVWSMQTSPCETAAATRHGWAVAVT